MERARPWWWKTALVHGEADEACERKWSCACGACRSARKAGETPETMAAHVAFARLERVEGRAAAIRSLVGQSKRDAKALAETVT